MFPTISHSPLLQIGTISMLLLLVANKVTSEVITTLGTASEEIFRGDRLPPLKFPETSCAEDRITD
ncbi:hypothetical protein ACE09Y_06465 [Raphidiopsis sp. BLCC-F218]